MISIVIPVYNGEPYITSAIESIRRQKGDWELLIVDDGSTDSTPVIARRYADDDSRIRLLQSPAKGVTAARMHGTRMAQGEFVFFMDADDELPSDDVLQTMAEAINADHTLDVVTGDIEHADTAGNTCIQRYARSARSGIELFNWITDHRTGFLWGKCIRREIMMRLPLIPLNMRFCEDFIQMLQIGLMAKSTAHIEKTSYRYIQHPESACNRRKTRLEYANQFLDFAKALVSLEESVSDLICTQNNYPHPAVRIRCMYLYYMRLYLAVSGKWSESTKHLKRIFRSWLFDAEVKTDPLFTPNLQRQCLLALYVPRILAAMYVPMLKYRYKRIF